MTTGLTPRLLVSIDPGIDRSAAAIWLPVEPSNDLEKLASRLVVIRECHTTPADRLEYRLSQLASWASLLMEDVRHLLAIGQLVAIGDRARCVVEYPAFAGMFRGRTAQRSKLIQPNAAAMGKLYVATGAIVAGLSRWCPDVVLEDAAKVKRDHKQDLGRRAIERAIASTNTSLPLPNNDDSRSAVYIGLCALAGSAAGRV